MLLNIVLGIIIFFIACVGLGIAIALIICIPSCIFALPYVWWLCDQQSAGRYKNVVSKSVFRNNRNAYRFYKSLITKIPPAF